MIISLKQRTMETVIEFGDYVAPNIPVTNANLQMLVVEATPYEAKVAYLDNELKLHFAWFHKSLLRIREKFRNTGNFNPQLG